MTEPTLEDTIESLTGYPSADAGRLMSSMIERHTEPTRHAAFQRIIRWWISEREDPMFSKSTTHGDISLALSKFPHERITIALWYHHTRR